MQTQTLKFSVSLPDDGREEIELRIATGERGEVVIALPLRQASPPPSEAERAHDDYVLGGYAGI